LDHEQIRCAIAGLIDPLFATVVDKVDASNNSSMEFLRTSVASGALVDSLIDLSSIET